MRISRFCRALLLASVFSSVAIIGLPQTPAVQVWAIQSGNRKVYHCPGSKWYKIGEGTLMGECDAIKAGYRPAYTSCGSSCLN